MMKLRLGFCLIIFTTPLALQSENLDWNTFMSHRNMNLPDLGYGSISCSPDQMAVLGSSASFKLGGDEITLTELHHQKMTEADRQACLAIAQVDEQIPDHISSNMGHQYIMNYSRCYELHMTGRPVEMAFCTVDVNGGISDDIIQCQSDYLIEIRFNGLIGHFQQTQSPFVKESIITSFGECAQVDINYINTL